MKFQIFTYCLVHINQVQSTNFKDNCQHILILLDYSSLFQYQRSFANYSILELIIFLGPMSHISQYQLRSEPRILRSTEVSSFQSRDSRRNDSVASNGSESVLSQDSSRGMITCGVKIRNISTSKLKTEDSNHKFLHRIGQQKITNKQKFMQSNIDKEGSGNIKTSYKRSQSFEMDSTKTDSPRASTFVETANRLNTMKLATDYAKIQSNVLQKVTIESLLLEDRQRLEKLVREKVSQIMQLNKTLNDQRKSSQSKIRQLQLQIQMNKYTNQQMIINFNLKLQGYKKEINIKDSLINQLTKQIKSLEMTKNQKQVETRKQKQEHKRQLEQLKVKIARLQKDISCSNKVIEIMKQQNLRIIEINKNQSSRLDQVQKNVQRSNSNKMLIQNQRNRHIKSYRSLEKHIQLQSPCRNITIQRDRKQQQLSIKKQIIQDQKKTIKKLQESQKKLQRRIFTLEQLVEQCNNQMVRERIKSVNKLFKQRY